MNKKAFEKYLATGTYVPAEDDAPMTDLERHDRRFHPEGYEPGDSCKYREALARGDSRDDLLAAEEAEKVKERTIYDSEDRGEEGEDFFDDEKANLDKQLDGNILVIADLGLWNGRKSGYREIGSNLNDILSVGQGDFFKVYYDGETGEVKARDIHHDGTNNYVFREILPDVDIEELKSMIYNGNFSQDDVDRYTKPLGKYVCDIYGWELPKDAKPTFG